MPTKPHALEIRFAGEDYTPDQPQPDIRVENFCALIAHGKSKRAAVILSFPNASKDSASFRASRVLSDDRVRDRIAYLRAKIAQATASVSPALSASARAALEEDGGRSDNLGQSVDNSGQEKLDDSNIVGEVKKRRLAPPADLTPAELRRIIAEGARNGNSSAINAAIKLLDAQLSAPPQVSDPAGLCAILFNGGGGGETLPYIASRLFDIFGKQETISYFVSCQSDTKDEQGNIPFIMRPCDTTAQPSQPNQQPQAQADDAWPAAGGGGGEGGEDARPVEV